MTISYDSEVDRLSIQFPDTTVTSQHVAEGIAVDYAADERTAGIEILDARARFGDAEVFRRVVPEEVALGRLGPTSS